MLSVIKHAVDTIFLFQQQSTSAQLARCVQHSSCSAKLHFFDSCGPVRRDVNSNNRSVRFMESYGTTSMSCKSANLKKSSSKWLYSRQTINTAFAGRDFCDSVSLHVEQRR